MSKEKITVTIPLSQVEKLLVAAYGIHEEFANAILVKSNLTRDVILEFTEQSVFNSNKPFFFPEDFKWESNRYDVDRKTKILLQDLNVLNLPIRTYNVLQKHFKSSNRTVRFGDIARLSYKQIGDIKGMGKKRLDDLVKRFEEGFELIIRNE